MSLSDTLYQIALVVGVALLLLGQFRYAGRHYPELQALLRLQACFWGLAYVARPLYLVVDHPKANTPLGDPRLTFDTYGQHLTEVLEVSLLGQLTFLGAILAISFLVRHRQCMRSEGGVAREASILLPVGITFFAIGWVGRLGWIAGLESIASALLPFGTVGGCLAILMIKPGARSALPLAVCAVLCSEAVWAVIFASKAAIISVVTALVFRWLREPKSAQIGWRLSAAGLAMIAAFMVLQPLKGIDTAAEQSSRANSMNDIVDAQFVAVLERFDGISAITDAVEYPHQLWLAPAEFAQRAVVGMVPKGPLLRIDSTLGQRWTREVKAYTFPDQYMNVSLAAGPTAEGYVLAGPAGVALENTVLAIATLFAAGMLRRGTPAAAVAASFLIFSTILFEQGVLGLADGVAKIVQLSIAAAFVATIARRLRGEARTAADIDRRHSMMPQYAPRRRSKA